MPSLDWIIQRISSLKFPNDEYSVKYRASVSYSSDERRAALAKRIAELENGQGPIKIAGFGVDGNPTAGDQADRQMVIDDYQEELKLPQIQESRYSIRKNNKLFTIEEEAANLDPEGNKTPTRKRISYVSDKMQITLIPEAKEAVIDAPTDNPDLLVDLSKELFSLANVPLEVALNALPLQRAKGNDRLLFSGEKEEWDPIRAAAVKWRYEVEFDSTTLLPTSAKALDQVPGREWRLSHEKTWEYPPDQRFVLDFIPSKVFEKTHHGARALDIATEYEIESFSPSCPKEDAFPAKVEIPRDFIVNDMLNGKHDCRRFKPPIE